MSPVSELAPMTDADLAFTLQPGVPGVGADQQALVKGGPLTFEHATFVDVEP